MARQIEHRSTSTHPAERVYATMVDRDYLDARLARIGGPGAGVLEYSADPDGARYRLRHGLDAKDMPAIVRNVLSGDIVIERTESWTRTEPGRYVGDSRVDIHGTPASAVGGMRLRDVGTGGSELVVRTEVTVKVPLIGGTIEGIVAEQVMSLLAAETAFTQRWLEKQQR